MKKIRIKDIDEFVYYEKMKNGLEVYLYTKDNVHNNYVTFTTKYGSVYNEFVPINEDKMIKVPKGIAHFLEHKVFVQKEDPQPMEFFARSGTICNAYTTFKNTTYLFYATESLKENINYLLDYVQNIYLTPESVESEKGIITEEIHMYEDRPNDILIEKIRQNCLHDNPFKDSIIGTVADIENITKENLETCYYTFYHPSNMFMVICGNYDPEEIMDVIRKNQDKKEFDEAKEIKVKEFKEEDSVAIKKEVINVDTSIPKVAYTLKLPIKNTNLSRRRLHLYMYILFTTLFDETSSFDERLKEEKIINNTTFINLLNCDTHLLISLINETNKYQDFLDEVKKKLSNMEISEKDFNRKKKVLISNEVFAYDDVSTVGDIIVDNIIYNNKLEDNPIEIINSLNMKELLELIKKIDVNNASTVILESDK
ncbi:MAG: EF-P 5-aminopentanol modification-associated protein YfmH [Bacilli bacterium]